MADIPASPGTAPIPPGNVRLFHYTPAPADAIRQQGLLMSHAKGENYMEPNQIWASGRFPENSLYSGHNVVEFSVPVEDPRWVIGKYSPGVQYDPNAEDQVEAYKHHIDAGNAHVTFGDDIDPSEIVAVHEPWHAHYRYFQENNLNPADYQWLKEQPDKFQDERRALEEYEKSASIDITPTWGEGGDPRPDRIPSLHHDQDIYPMSPTPLGPCERCGDGMQRDEAGIYCPSCGYRSNPDVENSRIYQYAPLGEGIGEGPFGLMSKWAMAFPGEGWYWHVSPQRYRDSIQRHGLDYTTQGGEDWSPHGWSGIRGNYLTRSRGLAATQSLYADEPYDVWAVNTDGLTLNGDKNDTVWREEGGPEPEATWVYTQDPIGPERLELWDKGNAEFAWMDNPDRMYANYEDRHLLDNGDYFSGRIPFLVNSEGSYRMGDPGDYHEHVYIRNQDDPHFIHPFEGMYDLGQGEINFLVNKNDRNVEDLKLHMPYGNQPQPMADPHEIEDVARQTIRDYMNNYVNANWKISTPWALTPELEQEYVAQGMCPRCHTHLEWDANPRFKDDPEIYCPNCGWESESTVMAKTAATTMYHVAPYQRRESIKENGLMAKAESPWLLPFHQRGIYLWDTPTMAHTYAVRAQPITDPDIWAVDVTGLNLQEDPFFQNQSERERYRGPHEIPGAFLTQDNIPPDRLHLAFPNPWHDEPGIKNYWNEDTERYEGRPLMLNMSKWSEVMEALPDLNYVLDYNPGEQRDSGWQAYVKWIGPEEHWLRIVNEKLQDLTWDHSEFPKGTYSPAGLTWKQAQRYLLDRCGGDGPCHQIANAEPDKEFKASSDSMTWVIEKVPNEFFSSWIIESGISIQEATPADEVYEFNGGIVHPDITEGQTWFNAYSTPYDDGNLVGSIFVGTDMADPHWNKNDEAQGYSHGEEVARVWQAFVAPEYRNTDAFLQLARAAKAWAQELGLPLATSPIYNEKLKALIEKRPQLLSAAQVTEEEIPEDMLMGYQGVGFRGQPVRFAIRQDGASDGNHPYFKDRNLAAFADFFDEGSYGEGSPPFISIGYVATSPQSRGQGYARQLMQAIYDAYPDARIRWGKLMEPQMEHLREDFMTRYPERTAAMPNGADLGFQVGDRVELPHGTGEGTVIEVEPPAEEEDGTFTNWVRVKKDDGSVVVAADWMLQFLQGLEGTIAPDIMPWSEDEQNYYRNSFWKEATTMYHGTTNQGWDVAQQRGGIYPRDMKELAAEVADYYGIDPDELYNHPYFEFGKWRAETEPDQGYVFLTSDPKIAEQHARIRNEQLQDALHAAWRILKGTPQYELEGDFQDEKAQFEREYHQNNNLTPVILTIEGPVPGGAERVPYVPLEQVSNVQYADYLSKVASWKFSVSAIPAQYTPEDPLDLQGKQPVFKAMDSQWWKLPDAEQEKAVVNAFRATMLSPRLNLKNNAIMYQEMMSIPPEESDPDVFEQHARDLKARWDRQGQGDLMDEIEPMGWEQQTPGKLTPGFWTNIRRLAALGPYADALRDAAVTDMEEFGGSGQYFREQVLKMGIPGVGPKVASFAWLALNPKGSDLGTLDVWMMRHLNQDVESPNSPSHYFDLEDQLRDEKDALYGPDTPLGQYQWGVWDKLRTPGYHQDHSPLRAYEPTPYWQVAWGDFNRAPRPQQLPQQIPGQEQLFAKTAGLEPGVPIRWHTVEGEPRVLTLTNRSPGWAGSRGWWQGEDSEGMLIFVIPQLEGDYRVCYREEPDPNVGFKMYGPDDMLPGTVIGTIRQEDVLPVGQSDFDFDNYQVQSKVMYHISGPHNRQSILEHGLDWEKSDPRSRLHGHGDEWPGGNYLFPDYSNADLSGEDDIWEVNVDGLNLEPDPYGELTGGEPEPENGVQVTFDKIGPERLKLVRPSELPEDWQPWYERETSHKKVEFYA